MVYNEFQKGNLIKKKERWGHALVRRGGCLNIDGLMSPTSKLISSEMFKRKARSEKSKYFIYIISSVVKSNKLTRPFLNKCRMWFHIISNFMAELLLD